MPVSGLTVVSGNVIHVYTHIQTDRQTHTDRYSYTQQHTLTHTHKHMHTHTHTHTHTNTHTRVPEIVAIVDGCMPLPGPTHMPAEGGATDTK